MRVLVVSDSYPPLVGGATRAVHLLASGLIRRGHEVQVVTTWQAGAPARQTLDGVEVHRVDGWFSRLWRRLRPGAIRLRYTPPPLPDPSVVRHVRRLLARQRPDVVLSYGWLTYSTALAGLGTGVPLVLSVRDYANICPLRTLVRDGRPCDGPGWRSCLPCVARQQSPLHAVVGVPAVLGQRRLLRRASALHSCSGFVHRVAEAYLPAPRPRLAAVIPDYRVGPPPPTARLEGLPTEPYVLFVGPLRTIKGVDALVRAYAQLDDPPPLVLIGTESPDPLPALPPGVVLLGPRSHDDVMAAWSGALFGVAPSVLPEPLGNVVHEAMSCGKPVVGSVTGGHGEMITDGEDGLLVPNGDVEALAAAMHRLLDDADLRERLGRKARRSSLRFTEAVQLPAFDAFLTSVAARDQMAAGGMA